MQLFVTPKGDMWGKMPEVMSWLESKGAQNYKVENLGVWCGEQYAFTRPWGYISHYKRVFLINNLKTMIYLYAQTKCFICFYTDALNISLSKKKIVRTKEKDCKDFAVGDGKTL